jgi:UDP-N-acetyl-D-mannosaminuronic acid dehydrogenase
MSADTVAVLGLGYVGLPAAMLLARSGCTVHGVDIDQRRVDAVNSATVNLGEQDLEQLLREPEVRRNLRATTRPAPADAFIIAVPTPLNHRKKIADLSLLVSALESIVPELRKNNLVVVESTVPPLTCRELVTPLLEKGGLKVGSDLLLAHCPERILPGNVLNEIIHNDRVIGGTTPEAAERANALYRRFVRGELWLIDDVSAEAVKLLENTYRDVNIALANDFAAVAETLGIDAMKVIDLANRHPRVNLLRPGIGVGGHCIPIDPWFIKEVDPANSRLIFAARLINDGQPAKIAASIRRRLRDLADPRIVAIGATYKPNVPDDRESPAIEIVRLLREDGYNVTHYDPLIAGMTCDSLAAAAGGADCLTILVEHDVVIAELDASSDRIRSEMRTPIVMRFYPTQ